LQGPRLPPAAAAPDEISLDSSSPKQSAPQGGKRLHRRFYDTYLACIRQASIPLPRPPRPSSAKCKHASIKPRQAGLGPQDTGAGAPRLLHGHGAWGGGLVSAGALTADRRACSTAAFNAATGSAGRPPPRRRKCLLHILDTAPAQAPQRRGTAPARAPRSKRSSAPLTRSHQAHAGHNRSPVWQPSPQRRRRSLPLLHIPFLHVYFLSLVGRRHRPYKRCAAARLGVPQQQPLPQSLVQPNFATVCRAA